MLDHNNQPIVFLPSFFYCNSPANLADWHEQQNCLEKSTIGTRQIHQYLAPDKGILLSVDQLHYREYPAVEVRTRFTASGKGPSEILSKIAVMDLTLPLQSPECTIRYLTGSQCKPTDFCARRSVLAERSGQQKLQLTVEEGRSSSSWMPYIGVDMDALNGYEIAIGWSGNWKIDFSISNGNLRIQFGMLKTHFYLEKDESVIQPSFLLFKRENCSVAEFQQQMHRFFVKYKAPRDSKGNLFEPLLPVTASGGNRTDEQMRSVLDYIRENQLPFNTFWVDAGWAGPPHEPDIGTNCGNFWWRYAGHWQVNPTIHPHSLSVISEYAHACGLKFLLWFEPERLAWDSPILAGHPEYATDPEDLPNQHCNNLLNLGNSEAGDKIFETVCRMIDENKVDIYRQDFNIEPGNIWNKMDLPDRQGIHEIQHIAGLYKFWSKLRQRYPDMLLENCASGGRRMDYELMSYSHCYCRSDYLIPRHSPDRKWQFLQGQNATLNTMVYVPFQGNEANPADFFNDYEFLSLSGSGVVFTPLDWDGRLTDKEFSPEETAYFKRIFTIIDRMRKLSMGDFRPLTPPADLSESCWVAYQAMNPAAGEGYAIFFRRRLACEEAEFQLGNIDCNQRYRVENLSQERKILSGRELQNLKIKLEKPESVQLIFYEKES